MIFLGCTRTHASPQRVSMDENQQQTAAATTIASKFGICTQAEATILMCAHNI